LRVTPAVRVGISVGVVAIILWRVPVGALWSALRDLNGQWLWPALAAALGALAIRTIKWKLLLQAGGSPTSTSVAMRSLFGGFALGVVTPGRLGEFGRYLFIPEAERSKVVSLNVLDRFLDSWSVATFAILSLFLAGRRPAGMIAVIGWLVFIPVVFGLPRLVSRFRDSPKWNRILGAQLRNASPALGKIAVAPFAGWSLLSTSLDITTFYFLLRAFHPAGFIVAPATYPWIVMASGIPLSLGGLGLREGTAAVLLAHYSIPAAVATDVALVLFAFLSLLPGTCGGILLLLQAVENRARPAKFSSAQLSRNLREDLQMCEK
jgi:glycosyltransferase 2 family protein